MNYFNHPDTKEYRRQLRRESTPSERMLWKKLCRRQVDGYKFRQQHGFGIYIMDFYCPELRLCIEVDGSVHDSPEAIQNDKDRTLFLNQHRIKVIRFRNEEIETDIDSVIQRIKDYINKYVKE